MWAIDALLEPPVRIDTATTRVPRRQVQLGRQILEEAGVDWRKIKGTEMSGMAQRRRSS
jgi:hypothetical protein